MSFLLINGRRSGTGNISEINLDNVERVENNKGAGAVQYGASALGGVINIITNRVKKSFLHMQRRHRHLDYKKNEVGMSGKVNNFDFSLSGSIETQGDYDTGKRQRYYNSGFDSKDRISLNAGWTFWEDNRIAFTFTGYEGDKIGSPSYLSRNDLDDYVDNSLKNYDITYTAIHLTTDGMVS
jgi:vitamin B12 transporter